jgi:hypothetical protein
MPTLTPENCEVLHEAFLKDYYLCFEKLKVACDVFVVYAPENFNSVFLNTIPKPYQSFVQEGNDIGARMHNAFLRVFKKGYEKAVLVGCDIPHIQPNSYEKAFDMLEDKDMAICPTYDGGYCLIGLKRPQSALFMSDVHWGNQSVIDRTYAVANQLNLDIAMLEKYRDIDLFEDLMLMRAQFDGSNKNQRHIPVNTLEYLEELIEKMVI